MPSIHLIEQHDSFVRIDKESQIWESGDWVLSEATAKSLVGGNVYFHKNQQKPSFFGGVIQGYRLLTEPHPSAGRYVLIFKANVDAKDVLAGTDGWGNEKKLILEQREPSSDEEE